MSELVDKAVLVKAMTAIAYGRTDNGRALGGSIAQALAREALEAVGLDWARPRQSPQGSEEANG